ncbi:fucoxanthin chlorophyll a/c protein [Fragilariopsis cylindrus CCMP1102]|uniref:Fucoxanthin chlorophyll a/c protein n=1 Tax=Fragilariopsis cylindrus CCMP1102 TaxID=635003 RepID=A0A1E7FSE6_9STRA|nr:fucoxanthin chlorophyll a/c protein [Fragilariopsis cylindrus CCMP1102]|eukprot:OEU21089.1 fucoxanthin chlorophyll a/c protein [Fragilariopsis cylindrus CCMP1102]
MAKFSAALIASLIASSSAFAPQSQTAKSTAIQATGFEEVGGVAFDPLGLAKLGTGESFDTFPGVFPDIQYLQEAEIKHGRQAMIAWTGVWATHQGGMGLGMQIPGFPNEPDWTKALGVFAKEQPGFFVGVLLFIAVCEGESVGHSGDNFRGKSTKVAGNLNFDFMGLQSKLSPEAAARYKIVETKNGRLAMIAMASLFAYESIPGSVPIMDIIS